MFLNMAVNSHICVLKTLTPRRAEEECPYGVIVGESVRKLHQ